jgi:hypothetical protein
VLLDILLFPNSRTILDKDPNSNDAVDCIEVGKLLLAKKKTSVPCVDDSP